MSSKRDKSERRWGGVAVSDGAVSGRVLRVHSGGRTGIYLAGELLAGGGRKG